MNDFTTEPVEGGYKVSFRICPKNPNGGDHCWHTTYWGTGGNGEVCCWCGTTKQNHGPHVPYNSNPIRITYSPGIVECGYTINKPYGINGW